MFKSFEKINRYYLSGALGHREWTEELLRRASGRTFSLHDNYFHHHNPLLGIAEPLRWIVDRYRPAFDFMDGKRYGRVLEMGCAHGLSTWFLTDIADEVYGVDVNPGAIAIASTLFPEVRFVAQGIDEFLAASGLKFDVMLSCYGPANHARVPILLRHTKLLIQIGYRNDNFRHFATWSNKLRGRQLSFDATLVGEGCRGMAPGYLRYFFTRRYLQHLRHSVAHRLWPQF